MLGISPVLLVRPPCGRTEGSEGKMRITRGAGIQEWGLSQRVGGDTVPLSHVPIHGTSLYGTSVCRKREAKHGLVVQHTSARPTPLNPMAPPEGGAHTAHGKVLHPPNNLWKRQQTFCQTEKPFALTFFFFLSKNQICKKGETSDVPSVKLASVLIGVNSKSNCT